MSYIGYLLNKYYLTEKCIIKNTVNIFSNLERVWRKGNPLTLLVGMQTSTATMENSVEIP